ncbi:MAG: enoyl-CoA hydratase/carnithine racemase [Gammaproteobacteria bacterium]|jgi:enoyl-CoA hydratase/carnithine racemase
MSRVEIERDGAIAVLRMNRPEVLNAIDQAMWLSLLTAFRELATDPSLRVCLLTGNGRGFCSGADLKETAWHGETTEQSRVRIDTHHQQLTREMVGLTVPIIACINGWAMGGGVEIALACDIRLASSSAMMGFPEASIGRFITGGASLLLPRTVGLSRAKRLLYTSEHFDAQHALAIGLVDEVHAPEELLQRGMALAEQIVKCAPASVSLMKRTLDEITLAELEAALTLETDALVAMYAGSAIDDGAKAFVEQPSKS